MINKIVVGSCWLRTSDGARRVIREVFTEGGYIWVYHGRYGDDTTYMLEIHEFLDTFTLIKETIDG